MKHLTSFLIVFALTLGVFTATSRTTIQPGQATETTLMAGKAYWYTYYLDQQNKKLYLTRVYNNDCNHCAEEIRASFKKWLIMNDYLTNPMGSDIQSMHDVDAADLDKRRDETILKFKKMSYSVVNVSYSYTEK